MSKEKIVVIGSVNMDYTVYVNDFPKEGETITGISRSKTAGGKGLNQAIAAKRAGADVTFIGAIGSDEDGMLLQKVIHEEGLEDHLEKMVGSMTGNATILVNKKGQNQIIILAGANGGMTQDVALRHPYLVDEASFVMLQNEIPASANETLLRYCARNHKKTLQNPAPFRKIPADCLPLIWCLTPNETELKGLTGLEDAEEGARQLLHQGVHSVLVTLGSKGSLYLDAKEKIFCPAFPVQAVDTVAAGDTYLGYLTASLAEGMKMQDAMRFASKAASLAVSRKGAIPSIPARDEVFL